MLMRSAEKFTPDFKSYDGELQTVDKDGVEVFAVGVWNGDKYSVADLYSMVDAFPKVGFEPPIKLGHETGQEDAKTAKRLFGEPALGYVKALRVIGDKLYADLKQIPKKVADLITAGAFKRISSEVYWDYTDDSTGKTFPRVLKAISFLGAKIPALTNLKAIESLYQKGEGGKLFAYDGEREYRLYCMEPHVMPSHPKKDKVAVNYVMAAGDAAEKCATCKFYQGMGCALVEGEIAPQAYCDLYEARAYQMDESGLISKFREMLDSALSVFKKKDDEPMRYDIEKRGDEWCLIAKGSGKKLGCHKDRAGAEAQEAAIKANMEKGPDAFYITLEQMREVCPGCADKMAARNFAALKISKDDYGIYQVNLPKATVDALCERFGEAEGFRTRCMGSSTAGKMDEPGAFCNALKRACHGAKQEENSGAAKANETGQGGREMEQKDIEALLEKQKQEMQKDFDAKLGSVKAEAKAEAEAEFKTKLEGQGKQIRELEAKNRKERIAGKIDQLKRDGKVPRRWEARLKAVFDYLPEEAAHKYANDNGESVEEKVAETLWKMLEESPVNFLKPYTQQDPIDDGDGTFSDPVGEIDKRAKAHMKDTGEKSLQKAYSVVLKADPVLAREYDKKVTGRQLQ